MSKIRSIATVLLLSCGCLPRAQTTGAAPGAQEPGKPAEQEQPEKPAEQNAPDAQKAPGEPERRSAGRQSQGSTIRKLLLKRPEIPTDKRGGQKLQLSLQECLRLASAKNIDLRIDRLLELIAREDIAANQGLYDIELFMDGEWRRGKAPARNTFQPSSRSKYYGVTAGLRKKFLSGLVAEFSYGPSYTEQRVNSSAGQFPEDFFEGNLRLTLTQPLLRGAWWEYHEADIERAKHEYVARRYDFERNRQTILEEVARAYYELAFARENWVVSYYSLELARERLRNTESRIRLGGLAPRDRVADQAEVARKQEELIVAETTILDAEDSLRRLVLGFAAESDWDLIFVPTVDLSAGDPKIDLPSWRDAALVARKNRPDVLALMRRVQSARLKETQTDRDLLPQLDLSGGYEAKSIRDDGGDLNADLWEGEFPSYFVELQFSVPLGNRVARARHQQARLDVRRLMTELSVLHIDIIRQVREAIRRLERLEKSILAARESVRLAENNLEAEQIKKDNDSSTQFEVQERANELSDAASRLIRSRLDYRQAWFELLSVQGRLDEFSRLPRLEGESSEAPKEESGK